MNKETYTVTDYNTIDGIYSTINLISLFYNEKFNNRKLDSSIPVINTSIFHLHPKCFCGKNICFYCQNPNFSFYPYQLDLYWFKYPKRDTYCFCANDIELSGEKIMEILSFCKNAIEKQHILFTFNGIKLR